jgi:hypothetical protein
LRFVYKCGKFSNLGRRDSVAGKRRFAHDASFLRKFPSSLTLLSNLIAFSTILGVENKKILEVGGRADIFKRASVRRETGQIK